MQGKGNSFIIKTMNNFTLIKYDTQRAQQRKQNKMNDKSTNVLIGKNYARGAELFVK